MDQEVRSLLADLSVHLSNILDNRNPNDRDCACIVNNVSKALRDFGEKLGNRPPTQATRDDLNAQSDNMRPSKRPREVLTQEAAPKTYNLSHSKSQEAIQPKKRREKIPENPITSNSGNQTGETTRAKRKCTMNLNPFVKLTRIDVRAYSQELDRSNSRFDMEDEQRSVSQSDADLRNVNARRMRNSAQRKTITSERPVVEEAEEGSMRYGPNDLKNTNQNMYASNGLYNRLCVLCIKNEHHLVAHYVKEHPEHEVRIARPSPSMATAIRAQSQAFESHKSVVSGFCFFCETAKSMNKYNWAPHIMTHTGEPLYACTRCDFRSKTKIAHPGCRSRNFETIFEKNQSKDTYTAYMCKECNYLQVEKAKLVAHLTNEHEYRATEVEAHFEEVALVPDLSAVKCSIPYDFIDNDTLYKCTICHEQFDGADRFERHYDGKHGRVTEYTCACKEVVPIGGLKVASTHLMKHGADLYKCMLCDDEEDSIYFTEAGILDHFTDEAVQHNDAEAKPTFHYFHRDNERSTVSEITIDKFICATCNHESDKAAETLEHFKTHRGQMVDFKVLTTVKTSEFDGNKVIRTSYVAKQDKYILRQSFLCMKCGNDFPSKGLLLAHHNRLHSHEILEVRLDRPVLIALNEENASEHQSGNEQFDRFMTYSCYWCRNNNNNDNEEQLIGADAKTIREHWLAEHVDNDPTERPFRFYVDPLVKCNYCSIISTYKGLREHTEYAHPKSPICFVNINANDECPLCDFQGKRLSAHFSAAHEDILTVNMVNPNRFSDESITQLLHVDVHKKSMCDLCGESFNFEIDYKKHHQMKHVGKQELWREFVDGRCELLVSACCDSPIPSQNFFQHLKMHEFTYSCRQCDVKLVDIDEAALHDHEHHDLENAIEYRFNSLRRTLWKMYQRTKLIFGNGAVLYKHNVLGSTFDDTTLFDRFIQAKEKEYRAKFAKLLQAKSATQNESR